MIVFKLIAGNFFIPVRKNILGVWKCSDIYYFLKTQYFKNLFVHLFRMEKHLIQYLLHYGFQFLLKFKEFQIKSYVNPKIEKLM